MLTKAMKQKRISFCKKYEQWTSEQWSKVMFSDESMFKTIASRPKHVRRPPGSNRYDPKYTIKTFKHPDSVMVWGSFTASGRAGLYFLPKNATMNSDFYISCLNDHLLTFFHIHKCQYFLQDGAPCHTSKKTKKWLADKNIPLLDWPGNSPDLNPIENLWHVMKNEVARKDTSSIQKLKDAILQVWTNFSTSYLENLASSMPKRLQDVLQSKGEPSKY
jgi:arsenate reductase-like glutaredoxin family protein